MPMLFYGFVFTVLRTNNDSIFSSTNYYFANKGLLCSISSSVQSLQDAIIKDALIHSTAIPYVYLWHKI